MDSLTQAALGALCGEILLSRKLGWKGAAWGAAFGTFPDLDIIGYLWMDAAEQLRWHRGISHSLLMIPIASLFFAGILKKIHQKHALSFKRAFWFVFSAWATHIFIDCFNSYGTQIFEPFSDYRFAFNCVFIIDPFFTGPLILGLFFCLKVFKKKQRARVFTQYATACWLSLYFCTSLSIKLLAERYFRERFNTWGVTPHAVMSTPTPFNILCWRGVARDDEKYYITYWSIFDKNGRDDMIVEFEHGHELERDFRDSKDFQALKWFTKGWRKTYQLEEEPNSIYIAPLMMGEIKLSQDGGSVRKPPFLWKITKEGDAYKLERSLKMSKDVWARIGDVVNATIGVKDRVLGGNIDWMEGEWLWKVKK